MSYPVELKPASRTTYHIPSEARSYYGRYSRDGITVHHWDSPDKVKDSDHDNIVNYIYRKKDNPPNKRGSIHYVVSNKKITKMVESSDVAWHAQGGNPTTIGIEFSPHLNAEGYKRGGWLISELEKHHKKTLKLYKHSDWSNTDCPGNISLPRLRQEADKFKKIKGDDMHPTEQDVKDYFKAWEQREPTKAELADYTKRSWRYLTDKMLQDLRGEYESEIKQLKKSGAVDPELVAKAARYDQIKNADQTIKKALS